MCQILEQILHIKLLPAWTHPSQLLKGLEKQHNCCKHNILLHKFHAYVEIFVTKQGMKKPFVVQLHR